MTTATAKEPHATQLDRLLQSPPRQFLVTLWGLMLIGILSIGLFWLFVQHSSVNFQEQQRDQLGRHLSLLLADMAARNWTPSNLEQQANLASSQPLILEVLFHDAQGLELAHSRSRQSIEDYFGAKANPNPTRAQIFIEEVRRGSQLLGYVRVALNRALIDKPYREQRKLILYALLAMVGLAGCLAYYMGHHSWSHHLPKTSLNPPLRRYKRQLKNRAMNAPYLIRRFEQQPGSFTRGAQNGLLLLRWHGSASLSRRQLGALTLLHGGSLLAINPEWILLCLSDEKDSLLAERVLQCARLLALWCRLNDHQTPHWSLSLALDSGDAEPLVEQVFELHQGLLPGQTALNKRLLDSLDSLNLGYRLQQKQLLPFDDWRERLLQRQLNQLVSLSDLA